jgi:hypothetical protein
MQRRCRVAKAPEYKLIVVRRDGLVMETTFDGWHAESASDAIFHKEIEDHRTIFACTICSGDGRRQFFSDDGRAK